MSDEGGTAGELQETTSMSCQGLVTRSALGRRPDLALKQHTASCLLATVDLPGGGCVIREDIQSSPFESFQPYMLAFSKQVASPQSLTRQPGPHNNRPGARPTSLDLPALTLHTIHFLTIS